MHRFLLPVLVLFGSPAIASDFYYHCQNPSKTIELDFNLIRGTWVSIKGLSPYWTHLMLTEVKPKTHIFEVREAGVGEADFLRLEVPGEFLRGQNHGEVTVSSLLDATKSETYSCTRDSSQED